MKVHFGRVLGGVVVGMTVIVLAWWLWGPSLSVGRASAAPLNDGAAVWSLASTQSLAVMPAGSACVARKITGPCRCQMTLVFFDERTFRVQIASQTSQKQKGGQFISQWAPQTRAIACCNGGYFDPSRMLPASLEIASGVRTGTFGNSGATGGAFGFRKGALFLANERTFNVTDDITEFVQCGPLLVEQGQPAVMTDERMRNRRTFVITDQAGHWAIGVVDEASYSGLAAMLVNRQIIPEFQVVTALNLDGGPSTGLWWRDAEGKTGGISEKWRVRNVVLVIPK